MRHEEFSTELLKLSTRFGEKYYPIEVVGVLYDEVKTLDITWLRPVVAKWLGLHKPALYPEFAEAAKLEKMRIGYQNTSYGKKSWNESSMFTDGQRKFLFALTQKIVRRQIPDQDEFVKVFSFTLEKVIKLSDHRTAHNLFKEVSESYQIPYEPGFKTPAKTSGNLMPGAPVI